MISSPNKPLNHPLSPAVRQLSSNAAPVSKPNPISKHSEKPKTEPLKELFKKIKLPKAPDFTQSQQKLSQFFNKEKLTQHISNTVNQTEKGLKRLTLIALAYPTIQSFGKAINPFNVAVLLGSIFAYYQWAKTRSERHRKEIQLAATTLEKSVCDTCNLASDVILQTQTVEQTKARLHDRLSKSKYISSMGTDGSSTYTFIDSKPLFLVSDANEEKVFTETCRQLDESKKALTKANNQLNIDYSTFRFVMGAYGKDKWLAKKQSTKLVNVLSACAADDNALQHMSTDNFTELQNIVTDSIDKETKRYPGPYSKNLPKRFSQLQKRITPQPMSPPPTFFLPPAPPPKPPEPRISETKADNKKKQP